MTYPPPIFAVDDPAELVRLLDAVSLGALVTHGDEGFGVTHMPFVYDGERHALRGHMSLNNPHARLRPGRGLVIFQGVEAYVTPSFYPSKAEHGRVAPTWNYEYLHVHGSLRWIADSAWILGNVEALTNRFEADRAEPWKVSDAPADFTEKLLSRIVGLEIGIDRVECRRKLSQNQSEANRLGVIAGLGASLDPGDRRVAEAMAALEPPNA